MSRRWCHPALGETKVLPESTSLIAKIRSAAIRIFDTYAAPPAARKAVTVSTSKKLRKTIFALHPLGPKTPCHFGPIQNRHRNIKNEYIRHELVRCFQRCLSVCNARDYVEIALKQAHN